MSAFHSLLIIDDCAEDREVYRDYLSDDPHNTYEFYEAGLAAAGLELFLHRSFDAVLLDFYMPDMTGLEFLGQLQQRHLKVWSPIIMLTGQGNEDLAVQAMKRGVQDYLGKQQLQPEVLQRTVRSVIQQSHLHVTLNKTREQQRVIATTSLRIRQSLDLSQILDTAVAEVQQLLECDHVAVYQCGSEQTPTIQAELGSRCGMPLLNPEGLLTNSACSPSGLDKSWPEDHRDLIAPIILSDRTSSQGWTWGYFVAHQYSKQTPWQSEEQSLLQKLSVQLAIAIQQAELLSQTQTALEKAQELNHLKSQILATVSHEYRSPLAAILGAASTLDRHGESLEASRQARFLHMIQDKARHMTRLVDNMLVMHQCEIDQAKFVPSPMNLLQFLANLVEEHRETLGNTHELIFQMSGKTEGFWGDPGILRLIFDNLLSNAIKFSPNARRVNIHLQGTPEDVSISIKDTGIGIPKADQPHLFQSFSRASNARDIQGIGLGLSITKACIELHEGELQLESQEGEGTTMMVCLPKQPKAAQNIYRSDL
ncbi:MAG: ATP-binding protein [Cyanobacteria bacterium P01_D01_bin.156]